MKKLLLLVVVLFSISELYAQEMKVVTIVESIVPMGVGRSRIIENKDSMNVKNFTTERTDGKKSKQKEVKREDTKVKKFDETKLLNFYSAVGINFQNIASNDAIITSKINTLIDEGWSLKFVTSGVESDAGSKDGKGLFITRLFFHKEQPK